MAIKSKLTGVGTSPAQAQNIVGTVANSLTAAGSTQATAYAMSTDDWQIFTTVASGTGAILAPGTGTAPTPYSAGDEMMVTNHGANTLLVYPPTGGKIANGSANAGFSVGSTKSAFFQCIDGTNWAAYLSA